MHIEVIKNTTLPLNDPANFLRQDLLHPRLASKVYQLSIFLLCAVLGIKPNASSH